MIPFGRSASRYDVLYEDLPTVAEVDAVLARLVGAPASAFQVSNASRPPASPPRAREKKIVREGRTIIRRATPTFRGEVIEVRYEYETDAETFVELHAVRPRDRGSLERHLVREGFRVVEITTSAEPGDYDLSVVAEAR